MTELSLTGWNMHSKIDDHSRTIARAQSRRIHQNANFCFIIATHKKNQKKLRNNPTTPSPDNQHCAVFLGAISIYQDQNNLPRIFSFILMTFFIFAKSISSILKRKRGSKCQTILSKYLSSFENTKICVFMFSPPVNPIQL